MIVVFTLCSANYLSQAKTFGRFIPRIQSGISRCNRISRPRTSEPLTSIGLREKYERLSPWFPNTTTTEQLQSRREMQQAAAKKQIQP